MTHCNAGALATCGWGTATAPLFLAHAEGLALHVWVSETRPRLQGAESHRMGDAPARHCRTRCSPTAAGALLMRRGDVDIVLVGADRVAANGDVCNKIGTYDKALAARDNGVPFYVALPSPTLDPALASGDAIPIEARSPDEVLAITGRDSYGQTTTVCDRARGHARGQLRVRRHAGPARHRPRHRARNRRGGPGRDRRDVSGALRVRHHVSPGAWVRRQPDTPWRTTTSRLKAAPR